MLFKRQLFNFICLTTLAFSINVYGQENNKEIISYILKIDFPDFIKKIPNLCAYYKGYTINFNENICLIRQDSFINQIVLVITPEIKHKSEGNNIKYLERVDNKPCRVFYIINRLDKNNNCNWYFEEESLDNLPLRLPEGSLVILMDPKYVDCLTTEGIQEISKNSYGSLINLPKIAIKKDVKYENINTSMNYVWLASFDIRAIHTKLRTQIKKIFQDNQEVILSETLLER